MKTARLAALLAMILPLSALCSPVKVAVAANMQNAFGDIAAAFTRETGVAVLPAYASSGAISAQVAHGAPFELFLSADSAFTQKLYAEGRAIGTPRPYARGALVLWSLDPAFDGAHWQRWLKATRGKLAVANAQTAPYGAAALQALAYYHLDAATQSRLVIGENIGQTAQFVASGAAQAGFVAKSQVIALPAPAAGHWVEIAAASHPPIIQSMLLLPPAGQNPDARRLFDYMSGATARAILQRYGYHLP